jgi:hypothetical protein
MKTTNDPIAKTTKATTTTKIEFKIDSCKKKKEKKKTEQERKKIITKKERKNR